MYTVVVCNNGEQFKTNCSDSKEMFAALEKEIINAGKIVMEDIDRYEIKVYLFHSLQHRILITSRKED